MRELVRYFIFFFKLRRYTLVYMLLIMICAAFFETLGVTLFLPVIEEGNPNSPIGRYIKLFFSIINLDCSLKNILILMVVCMFVRTLFIILQNIYLAKVTTDFSVDLRVDSMRKLFESDYLYCISKDAGIVTNYLTLELNKLASTLKPYVNVLLGIIFSVFYTLIPLVFEPFIVALLIIIGTPIAYLISKANHITKRYSTLQTEHSGWLQSVVIQIVHYYKYLKSTSSYRNIIQKFDRECIVLGRYEFYQNTLNTVVAEGFLPIVVLFVASFLYFQVSVNSTNISQTIFLMLLLYRAISQIVGIQTNYRKFLTSVGSINIFKSMDREFYENIEKSGPNNDAVDFRQPIVFRDVSFKYPNSDYVLRNISFDISPRSTVGFVGPSGAGKSSLVTLLTGVLRPSEGEIFLGKSPYADLSLEKLRQGIGYVTQESVIFNDTVGNNITLWEKNETKNSDRVKDSAREANINDFIEDLPLGYQTILGDNGIKVSGGQRQRICIARELYKDAKVLIFDEATSSLDSETEIKIQNNIDQLRGTKTVILIAHRLSTVKNCDIIFLIKDGKIVENGNYDDLYRKNGLFRDMVKLQSTDLKNSKA